MVNKKDINHSNQALIDQFIKDKLDGVFPKNIILIGQSLGSAQAVYALERIKQHYQPSNVKVILISPFTSMVDLCKNTIDLGNKIMYDYKKMVRDRWDIVKRKDIIAQTDGVFIIHGDKDHIVPYNLGQQLSLELAGSKFYSMKGVGHSFKKPEVRMELFEQIQKFIDEEFQ